MLHCKMMNVCGEDFSFVEHRLTVWNPQQKQVEKINHNKDLNEENTEYQHEQQQNIEAKRYDTIRYDTIQYDTIRYDTK